MRGGRQGGRRPPRAPRAGTAPVCVACVMVLWGEARAGRRGRAGTRGYATHMIRARALSITICGLESFFKPDDIITLIDTLIAPSTQTDRYRTGTRGKGVFSSTCAVWCFVSAPRGLAGDHTGTPSNRTQRMAATPSSPQLSSFLVEATIHPVTFLQGRPMFR